MILDVSPAMWLRILFFLWDITPRNSKEEQISHISICLNDCEEIDESSYWGIYHVY